jgi:hypothetical protein
MTETTPAGDPAVIDPTPEVANAISAQLGGTDLTPEQIAQVLGAYNAVRSGDPVGTVVRNTDTGAIGHRVTEAGVHVWRCSAPDGTQWSDLSPTLPGWVVVERGAE